MKSIVRKNKKKITDHPRAYSRIRKRRFWNYRNSKIPRIPSHYRRRRVD